MELSSSYLYCLEGQFLKAQTFERIYCFGVQHQARPRQCCNPECTILSRVCFGHALLLKSPTLYNSRYLTSEPLSSMQRIFPINSGSSSDSNRRNSSSSEKLMLLELAWSKFSIAQEWVFQLTTFCFDLLVCVGEKFDRQREEEHVTTYHGRGFSHTKLNDVNGQLAL